MVGERDVFEAWLDSHRQLPVPLQMQEASHELFEHASCALCHTIEGTTAHALVGPDLDHLASAGPSPAGLCPEPSRTWRTGSRIRST